MQNIKLEDIETSHFVLVHGGGFGAWCWYKTIALLEEGGYKATAIDLTGSGVHSYDPNCITSLLQYVQPLTDFLEKLAEGEKVLKLADSFLLQFYLMLLMLVVNEVRVKCKISNFYYVPEMCSFEENIDFVTKLNAFECVIMESLILCF